jgi:hypothetical protein
MRSLRVQLGAMIPRPRQIARIPKLQLAHWNASPDQAAHDPIFASTFSRPYLCRLCFEKPPGIFCGRALPSLHIRSRLTRCQRHRRFQRRFQSIVFTTVIEIINGFIPDVTYNCPRQRPIERHGKLIVVK